jgi:uncharacterized repeat protein (TIGR01451 family)
MDTRAVRLTRRPHLLVIVLGIALCLAYSAAHAQTDADAAPQQDLPVVAQLTVDPAAVLPGEVISYALTLQNTGELSHQVTVSLTLPSGFDLPLEALPAGASYHLRSGNVQWTGSVAPQGTQTLVFSGRAPADPGPDGRLTTYVAVSQGAQTVVADSVGDNRAGPQIVHLSVTGWVGTPPAAGFSYTVADQTVHFTNLSEGVGPLSTWWEFGDGTTSTDPSPSHTYPGGGEYLVRLTTANPKGASTAAETVLVTPPTLQQEGYAILVDDETPAVGQPVYFGNAIEPISVTIQWNFGDGAVSDGLTPIHIYQEPGVYTVTRILGEGTVAIQTSLTLHVDYPPQATIQASRSTVSVGQLVNLTALTSTSDTASYYWDFGDGNRASSSSVAYSYSAPGSYPVTLAVSNDFGVALDTLTMRVAYQTVYLPMVMSGTQAEPIVEGEPEPPPAEVAEPEPAVPLPADPLAQGMLQAINAEREANGLAPLSWSDQLVRSAQHHTDDMAAHWFTGHIGSNGSRPVDRMRQASYTGDYAGECTAWGFDDFASALAWWMTSPPHRVIILSTVATEIGGAYTHNPDAPSVHYWTVDFGAR